MKVFGLHVVLRNHEKIFQVFFALTRSLVNMPEILCEHICFLKNDERNYIIAFIFFNYL